MSSGDSDSTLELQIEPWRLRLSPGKQAKSCQTFLVCAERVAEVDRGKDCHRKAGGVACHFHEYWFVACLRKAALIKKNDPYRVRG